MNKNEKFFLLQKIASLFTYSELLPDEFQDKFNEDLESVKKFISEYKVEQKNSETQPRMIPQDKPLREVFSVNKQENLDDEESYFDNNKPALLPSPSSNITKAPPPKPISMSQTLNQKPGFINYMKGNPPSPPNAPHNTQPILSTDKLQTTPKEKKSTFEFVSSALVPKLTEDRQKIMGDLSFPINLYMIIKIIDDKSSLFKIFEKYHKQHGASFVEFAENLYQLEQRRSLSFVRIIDGVSRDSGLIRIEEFFSEGKIISEENMAKATEVMKATGSIFIAKTLISMKLMNEESLGNCVKIQKWLARNFDKAPYVREELEVKTQKPEAPQIKPENTPQVLHGLSNIPISNAPVIEEIEVEKDFYGLMEFIVPFFNEKGKEIISSPDYKELAKRISIIQENKNLLDNYSYSKESFKKNKFAFMKFLSKLDSQDIFDYTDNKNRTDKPIWARLGELIVTLDLADKYQLIQAVEYKEENNTYIGDSFVHLGIIDENTLNDCLKIQAWLNRVLSYISYETSFVDVIKNVLMESFKCKVDIGGFQKIAFIEPIKDIVCIKYPITGKLNGWIYYISDRSFMNNLAHSMMSSLGAETGELDESYVGTVSSVIISNSLSKLSQKGIFNPSEMAKILMEKEVNMEKEIIVANGNQVSMIPLINQFGRFAICMEV